MYDTKTTNLSNWGAWNPKILKFVKSGHARAQNNKFVKLGWVEPKNTKICEIGSCTSPKQQICRIGVRRTQKYKKLWNWVMHDTKTTNLSNWGVWNKKILKFVKTKLAGWDAKTMILASKVRPDSKKLQICQITATLNVCGKFWGLRPQNFLFNYPNGPSAHPVCQSWPFHQN